jgi:hypothetical protein
VRWDSVLKGCGCGGTVVALGESMGLCRSRKAMSLSAGLQGRSGAL